MQVYFHVRVCMHLELKITPLKFILYKVKVYRVLADQAPDTITSWTERADQGIW